MPKISTSFAIAFTIHVLLLSLTIFFVNKKPSPILVNTSGLINVQFGPLKGGSAPRASIAPPKTMDSISNIVTSAAVSSSNEITHSASKYSNSFDEFEGNGGESYPFEDAAVTYKEPIYPRLAIKRELQGSVRLRIKVSIDGKPINTYILKSSGHELLDQAALEAVSHWQFQSRGASYFVEKTIIFQLQN